MQAVEDATEVVSGVRTFEIHIMPDEPVLHKGDLFFPLRLGMTATTDAPTDKRRIITYLFAPIVETIQPSSDER